MTMLHRKRVKRSLERTLCAPCPYCEGAGYLKSAQTVVGEILQEAQRIARPASCNFPQTDCVLYGDGFFRVAPR